MGGNEVGTPIVSNKSDILNIAEKLSVRHPSKTIL